MLKIGVCGADGSSAVHFGESRHAGIREIHRCIVVALHHFLDMDQIFCQRHDSKSTFHYKINDLCCCDTVSCHQMANLGQDRLANDFAPLYFFKNPGGPCVESISRTKPRYQWTGVENDRLHSPRSSRCDLLVERSVYLPCPMPLKWRSRSASEGRNDSAFSDVPSTIVSNARALGGNTSNPRGRTRPSSRSTSKVWKVIRKTYGDQTKPQVQTSRPRGGVESVSFARAIDSSNSAGLEKSGSGTLVLGGSNSFTGTTIFSGTSTSRPVLKTGIQNGQNVVRFDGTNDFLTGGTSGWNFSEYTLVAVSSPNVTVNSDTRRGVLTIANSENKRHFITCGGFSNFATGGGPSPRLTAFSQTSSNPGHREISVYETNISAGQFNVATGYFQENVTELFFNGVSQGRVHTSQNSTITSGAELRIGTRYGSSWTDYPNGDIAEIPVFSNAKQQFSRDRLPIERLGLL